MIANQPTIKVPVHTDEHGIIRVSGTRVTLDTVIARHHQGDTPEAIHAGFDVLPLNDVYAVIAYYLANRDALDAYLQHNREAAERTRQQIEAAYTPGQKARHDRLRKLVEEKRNQQDV